MTTTIRVSDATKEHIDSIGARTGRSLTSILADAIEDYDRKVFAQEVAAAYDRLTPDDRAGLQAEQEEWDATLRDGLDPDEPASDFEVAARPAE